MSEHVVSNDQPRGDRLMIGVRLLRREYDLITAIAEREELSRAAIMRRIIRAWVREQEKGE